MANSENKIYLSTNLKYLRIKNDKTQDQIAEICNKKNTAISNWEKGIREPDAVDIAILANYFNVSVGDLMLKDLRFEDAEIDNFIKENTISDEELEQRLKELNEKEGVKIIFDKDGELTEEELNQIVSHAMFVKEQHYKNKEKK